MDCKLLSHPSWMFERKVTALINNKAFLGFDAKTLAKIFPKI